MAAQHVILFLLSSILIVSATESLYSRACSGGDPPAACKKYCELCQTGCLPPGKTLATKTFYDVCNEEQKLQFEKEQNEKTRICQEYMDGLGDGSTTDPDDTKNPNNNGEQNGSQHGNEGDVGTATKIIDDVYSQIKNTSPIVLQIFTAVIGLLMIIIAVLTSQIRAERRKRAISETAHVASQAPIDNNIAPVNNNNNLNNNNDSETIAPGVIKEKWDAPSNDDAPNNTEHTSDGKTHALLE